MGIVNQILHGNLPEVPAKYSKQAVDQAWSIALTAMRVNKMTVGTKPLSVRMPHLAPAFDPLVVATPTGTYKPLQHAIIKQSPNLSMNKEQNA